MKEECTLSPNIHEWSITIQKNMVFSTHTQKEKAYLNLKNYLQHLKYSLSLFALGNLFFLTVIIWLFNLSKTSKKWMMPLNDDLWVCQIMITNHYNALYSSNLNLYIFSCKSAKVMYSRNEFNVRSNKIIILFLLGSLHGSVHR